MPEYLPIPVVEAKQIAERYGKNIVVIVAWDEVHQLFHTTTFGMCAEDKVSAHALGETLSDAAGCDLSRAKYTDDFRTLDVAKAKERIDSLERLCHTLGKACEEASLTIPCSNRDSLVGEEVDSAVQQYRVVFPKLT